jgi:hypothetical protein
MTVQRATMSAEPELEAVRGTWNVERRKVTKTVEGEKRE